MGILKKLISQDGTKSARLGSTHTKIGTIQRRLAWLLRKDDTQIHEAFHIKKNNKIEQRTLLIFKI